MIEDEDIFKQEMADVKPLKAEPRVAIKQRKISEDTLAARREAAQALKKDDDNYLSNAEVELLDPYYYIEFKRSGVQNGVFRKLKQGRYPQDARLDLHGMNVEQARVELFDFIKQCQLYDSRSIIIIHGKGNHSQSQARLKSYVNSWLPNIPVVQAFCSAQPKHGGVGAAYVLLAKSEHQKQQNRDLISRGRTL